MYPPAVSDAHIDASLKTLTQEGEGHPGKTQKVQVGSSILSAIGPWLSETGHRDHDVVICDPHTFTAAGDRVAAELKHAGRTVETWILPPQAGEEHLVCDDDLIASVQARLADLPDVNAIAVGAGTINDTVKMATTKLDRPYTSVATAASMNGYTSAIAAILSRGVKRTIPTQQAEAVFADLDVIQQAPAYLNQAGFGDLLSKPYSHADWLLSHLIRGVTYQERPARLLDEAFESLLLQSSAIGQANVAGIGTLTRTILLSGFTMAIAGTSSPASGGEHLVSHYWDMEQHCRHQPLFGLHGTQVGIATRLSAMLFERLVATDLQAIDLDVAVAQRAEGWSEPMEEQHPRLTRDVVAEVREQLALKQRTDGALRDELLDVQGRWTEIQGRIAEVLKPSTKMTSALRAAGAADRPSAIGVTREHAIHTLRVCRQIRGRYVALDLMDDLGLLHNWATEVVDAAERDEPVVA